MQRNLNEEYDLNDGLIRISPIDRHVHQHLITAATIAIAGVAIAAVSAGVGAYSAIQQGKAQEDAAKYSAAVDRNNAILASQKSQYEADRQRKRNLILRGKQQAAYAKSGVEITGSPEDVMFDSAIEGNLDILATRYAGEISTRDYEGRARLQDLRGSQAASSSYFNAGSSILSGAGQAASAYGNYLSSQKNPRF